MCGGEKDEKEFLGIISAHSDRNRSGRLYRFHVIGGRGSWLAELWSDLWDGITDCAESWNSGTDLWAEHQDYTGKHCRCGCGDSDLPSSVNGWILIF